MNEIERDWLLYAKGEQLPKNSYNRFLAAYIALNHLYGYDKGNECKRMVSYLSSHCERINPFDLDVSEYLAKPIQDMRPGKDNSVKVIPGNRDSLFKAIYQVRCNLFHGNKSFGNDRNERLVKQGADVIVEILSHVVDI